MKRSELEARLPYLPTSPGCYLFKDARGKVIYVGKAKSLRSRVRSYFQAGARPDPKTRAMLRRVADFDVLVTDHETEALILEANLVREYKPRYNVNLKDDKRYPYLKVTTDETFPRLLVVRRVQKDGATYFGPYTNVRAMRRTVKLISRVFMIRSCNLVIPPPKGRSYRVCLDYFIKRCPGPCEFKISGAAYGELIHGACLFLAGRSRELFADIELRMKAAADSERFEEAAQLRDQMTALQSVTLKQKVVTDLDVHRDILAFDREGKDAVVVALQIRDGILIGRQEFHLVGDPRDSDASMMTAFIKQYYLNAPLLPDEIFLPAEIEDEDLIAGWLKDRKVGRMRFHRPVRGEKVKLVRMARENASQVLREVLLQKRGRAERIPPALHTLAEELMLERPPLTIAAFDVSHLGAEEAVASCVYFDRARPRKSEYRHFKVKATAPDDYAAMREVVFRYLRRRRDEGRPYPDLLLIDGGRGQLSSAAEALHELGLDDQPMVGLAKRLDEIVFPYESDTRLLPKTSPVLRLLQQIRDEAHRFANVLRKQRARRRVTASELDLIPGIGPARRSVLLQHFGSAERVRAATLEELSAVPGLGARMAQKLFAHFRGPEEQVPGRPESA